MWHGLPGRGCCYSHGQDALWDIEGKSCTDGRSYIERMRAGYYPCPHGAQPEDPDGHRSIIDRYLAAPEDD
jgi:hypothetical protein